MHVEQVDLGLEWQASRGEPELPPFAGKRSLYAEGNALYIQLSSNSA